MKKSVDKKEKVKPKTNTKAKTTKTRGCKGKYTDAMPKKAYELAAKGLYDYQISKALGLNKDTYYNYINTHKEFSDAVKEGRNSAINVIENALFKRAKGYSVTEITEVNGENGKGTYSEKRKIVKHIASDPTSMIFFLKNKDPKNWNDKQQVEHSGEINHSTGLEQLTNEQLQELADKLKDKE